MAVLFGQVRRHRSCWCPPSLLESRYRVVPILLGPTSRGHRDAPEGSGGFTDT